MNRTCRIELKDGWTFTKEGSSTHVQLPHTWNAVDGQDGGGDYYRGTCTYTRTLSWPGQADKDSRIWLEFTGAEMTAKVFMDGIPVARHEDGFSTFRVDITNILSDRCQHKLTVEVSNGRSDSVYPQQADFTFYGGLYRPVYLVIAPPLHFALGRSGAPGILATAHVNLADRSADIDLDAWVEDRSNAATAGTVRFAIRGADKPAGSPAQEETIAEIHAGHAHTRVHLQNVRLWDGLRDPYLYVLTASILENGKTVDVLSQRFGCRVMQADPQKGFLLNGRPYPLRGVSRHQDWKGVGNALQPWQHRKDIDLILEIGANAVRLAHYQHSQEFYDLCDEKGLIVWAEIPFISMYMPKGRANTLLQLRELILQNRHHPSIFCWALSNEISTASTVDEALISNHRELDDLAHRLDPTRPTAIANAFMLEPDSPLHTVADLSTYNLYYGWYMGSLEDNDRFLDKVHKAFPRRCLGLTEYGADANIAFQTDTPSQGDYSEQYQCVYHEHMLKMIDKRPWLWCTFVWNMFDFAADGRDEGGAHGLNQKGLVTFDRKTRKDAFFLYKAWWSHTPFVHVCGRRYVHRAEETTTVTVYSNISHVTLFVDGRKTASQNGHRIFRFHVSLGPVGTTHRITAAAYPVPDAIDGSNTQQPISDSIAIIHTAQPDPAYRLQLSAPVTNWFSHIVIDQNFYSINDTVADLQANPQAAALLAALNRKMVASRGELAKKAMANKNLQEMIGRQRFSTLLRRAGLTDPSVAERLNARLQKIPKKPGSKR